MRGNHRNQNELSERSNRAPSLVICVKSRRRTVHLTATLGSLIIGAVIFVFVEVLRNA